jgi:NADH-quinone oxidoreductase subunit J
MALDLILLIIMVVMAIWAVMARSLLKAAIGLAAVSAIVTIFMFRFNCPLAGVFELSVCTGLITVIFLSTIGLTKPLASAQQELLTKDRSKKYRYLPVVVVLSGAVALCLPMLSIDITFVQKAAEVDARHVLWNLRQLDLFGQIIILIAGGFGAVILFKDREDNDW